MISVYIESGQKRVFACAVDWPGWCRGARDEPHALEALGNARERYAIVAKQAGLKLPSSDFEVMERVAGSATTDFGAPGSVPALDLEPLKSREIERLATLVDACWTVFDRVVAGAPAELRKGPRGGGRDRDKIVEHVLGAEVAYATKFGLRLAQPAVSDAAAISAHRQAIASALRSAAHARRAPGNPGWPTRYAARRIAWHTIDHVWEIQDRTESLVL